MTVVDQSPDRAAVVQLRAGQAAAAAAAVEVQAEMLEE